MSVQSTQTSLTIFKNNDYDSFFKDLVYDKIKFEVLNPIELGSEWSEVQFLQHKAESQAELLNKTDKILQTYQPKGLFNSFIDHRPEINSKDIHYINNHQEKAKFFKIIDKLEQYELYQNLKLELDDIVKSNPGREILIGENILAFKEKLDLFTEEVIKEFTTNHPGVELEEQIHQIDYIPLTNFGTILFKTENLEYILDYKESTHSHINFYNTKEFIDYIKKQQEIIVHDLKEFNFNPEKISKDNYLLLCSIYANLELEDILLKATSKIFHLSNNTSDTQTSYAFIAVHPDDFKKFHKILEKNKIESETTNWSKDIVVWSQSNSISPFKNVAQSLGTISSNQVDPSFTISIFFSLFFAFCLGDAFYGLILATFTGYFLFFKNLKAQFESMFQLFFISGVATVIFGALFNSWAGDLFFKTPINPLLESIQIINPLDPLSKAPVNQFLLEKGISPIVALLGLAVVIGLVNLMVGYFIKIINALKVQNFRAFREELNWFLFVIFGVMMIFNGAVPAPFGLIIPILFTISGLSFFITNSGKSIPGKILGGLAKFYNLIGFGSDLLSFTRLIAVGLTGGIIATVINLLAFLIYDSISIPVVNVLATALILIVGHLFNLTISLFGAYINPLRLHYVEFLPKFYEPSGQKLNFTNTDFKYLKLKN